MATVVRSVHKGRLAPIVRPIYVLMSDSHVGRE